MTGKPAYFQIKFRRISRICESAKSDRNSNRKSNRKSYRNSIGNLTGNPIENPTGIQ